MRSFFASGLRVLLPLFGLTATYAQESASAQRGIEVLEYSPDTAYTKLSIPCPGCFNAAAGGADDSLVFDLQVLPSDDLTKTEVVVNDQSFDILRDSRAADLISIPDTSGAYHEVYLNCVGIGAFSTPISLVGEEDAIQSIRLTATPAEAVDDTTSPSLSFVLVMRPASTRRLVALIPDSGSEMVHFEKLEELSISGESTSWDGDYEMEDSPSSDESLDLEAELETVALLENQAHQLQAQIADKKRIISQNLKQEREKLCLKHLIQECDGLISTAKALAQRICDKVGIPTGPSFQYAHMRNQHTQHMVALDSKLQPVQSLASHHCAHGDMYCADSANIPLMLTKNVTSYSFKPIDLVNPPNPLLRALQLVAGVLGIAALFAFLRKRCMSMRKRVERAADREERRNERAYRRAARRAQMRKRWGDFVNTVNCFRVREKDGRIEDYEEKRALILQDAFLEQDLDQAEKGEVMEAEIRELRYAHEIVASLVQVDHNHHRYDLVAPPVNDPPPPTLPPLARTSTARSRASTTYTLPSYTSESLPDYSSRPGDAESSSCVTNNEFTPSVSEDEGGIVSPVSVSSSSRRTSRYTPASSIPDSSPRPSQETIRTRPSGEVQGR